MRYLATSRCSSPYGEQALGFATIRLKTGRSSDLSTALNRLLVSFAGADTNDFFDR